MAILMTERNILSSKSNKVISTILSGTIDFKTMLNLKLSIVCLVVSIFASVNADLFKPDIPIKCNSSKHCPFDYPCCSPYSECGKGPICVGGCNPKFSYNTASCIPMPIIVYPFEATFDSGLDGRKVYGTKTIERYEVENSNDNNVNSEQYENRDVDFELNRRGFIHHSQFLVTNSKKEAELMMKRYDFTYSGRTNIDYDTGDILLAMPKRTTGSLVASSHEFLYGRASVRMKTARSQGVITAIVLISQVGDEIDYEFLGSRLDSVQTNHYFQGELDYTKMQVLPVSSSTYDDYHTYELNWTEEKIEWIIDGRVSRTLFKRDTWDPQRGVYRYPQTPARLEIAIWPGGGEKNSPGTVEWAGGSIDWDHAEDILKNGQFSARVHEITITPNNNRHMNKIIECLQRRRQSKKIKFLDLTEITVSYNGNIKPSFTEDSLIWHCDITPKITEWKFANYAAANLSTSSNSMINSHQYNNIKISKNKALNATSELPTNDTIKNSNGTVIDTSHGNVTTTFIQESNGIGLNQLNPVKHILDKISQIFIS